MMTTRKVQRGRDDLRLAGAVAAADLLSVAAMVDRVSTLFEQVDA